MIFPSVERVESWTSASGSIAKAAGEEGSSMTVLALPVDILHAATN